MSGAAKYWLTVATSASTLPTNINATTCPSCAISVVVISTSYTRPTALASHTTYYWQVQGYNDLVSPVWEGQYSLQWSFTTR